VVFEFVHFSNILLITLFSFDKTLHCRKSWCLHYISNKKLLHYNWNTLPLQRKVLSVFLTYFNTLRLLCYRWLVVCIAARRTMPFRLSELAQMSLTLRDVCLGIISLTHPDTRPVTPSTRLNATQQLDILAYVFRVCHLTLYHLEMHQ